MGEKQAKQLLGNQSGNYRNTLEIYQFHRWMGPAQVGNTVPASTTWLLKGKICPCPQMSSATMYLEGLCKKNSCTQALIEQWIEQVKNQEAN